MFILFIYFLLQVAEMVTVLPMDHAFVSLATNWPLLEVSAFLNVRKDV